jgi:hypothetical protein
VVFLGMLPVGFFKHKLAGKKPQEDQRTDGKNNFNIVTNISVSVHIFETLSSK